MNLPIQFLIIYIVFLKIKLLICINFSFKMPSTTMRCLGDQLPDKTLTIFTFKSSHKEIRVRLFDVNGNTIYNRENLKDIKITYTSTEAGNHQVCIDNYSNKEVTINFDYVNGIAAKDYTELVKKDNLKPMDLHLQKLEDMMGHLLHVMQSFMSEETKNLASMDSIMNLTVIFSVTILFSMGVITFIAVKYMQMYFRKRKVI